MMHRKSLKITVRPMGNSLRHKGWRTMHNAKRLQVFITFVMKSKWIRWTYKPSAGLAVSLWEPVLLVDSRMPYGADKKDHRGKRSLHKLLNHLSPVFTLSMSNTGLLSVNLKDLRSVMMASNRAASLHTGLDASDTMTSKYMFSVPYCRRLALIFSSGPRHFWFLRLDLPEKQRHFEEGILNWEQVEHGPAPVSSWRNWSDIKYKTTVHVPCKHLVDKTYLCRE